MPGQALFLLNSTFVRKQSLALAERVLKEPDADRVASAYRLTLGRSPTGKDVERARAFLAEYEAGYRPPPPAKTEKPKADKTKKADDPPFDPDQVDQTGEDVAEDEVRPKDAKTAAWLAFAQALYGSAEFRYVR